MSNIESKRPWSSLSIQKSPISRPEMNNHRGKLASYNNHLQVVEIIASAFFYSFSLFTTVPRVYTRYNVQHRVSATKLPRRGFDAPVRLLIQRVSIEWAIRFRERERRDRDAHRGQTFGRCPLVVFTFYTIPKTEDWSIAETIPLHLYSALFPRH